MISIDAPDGGAYHGRVTELSVGGCFITGPALVPGWRVRVVLKLPRDQRPVECEADILYRRAPTFDGPGGVGVAFRELSWLDERRIERTVEVTDLLHRQLMFALTHGGMTREALRATCVEVGLLPDLPEDEIRRRVELAIARYRSQ